MAQSAISNDPRSLRSRERIVQALREEVESGRNVTISAVTETAAVTRATFYNNFASLEEAAWFALSGDIAALFVADIEEQRLGSSRDLAGVESLQQIVTLLRDHHELTRLASSYRDDTGLPGIAAVLLGPVRDFRALYGDPDATNAEAEDVYIAAGLHGLFQVAVENGKDSASIARSAYDVLPEWMRNSPTR